VLRENRSYDLTSCDEGDPDSSSGRADFRIRHRGNLGCHPYTGEAVGLSAHGKAGPGNCPDRRGGARIGVVVGHLCAREKIATTSKGRPGVFNSFIPDHDNTVGRRVLDSYQ